MSNIESEISRAIDTLIAKGYAKENGDRIQITQKGLEYLESDYDEICC